LIFNAINDYEGGALSHLTEADITSVVAEVLAAIQRAGEKQRTQAEVESLVQRVVKEPQVPPVATPDAIANPNGIVNCCGCGYCAHGYHHPNLYARTYANHSGHSYRHPKLYTRTYANHMAHLDAQTNSQTCAHPHSPFHSGHGSESRS
jgi:hypothetical protein